jgi:isopentenyl diphosphate isomerase/L-lactate dehydrogenase-like FMN-dependent dehydrogenase
MILSTATSTPLEEVAKAYGTAPWYQLYMPRTWSDTDKLVKRAEDAGCPVIAWTVDVLAGRNIQMGTPTVRDITPPRLARTNTI